MVVLVLFFSKLQGSGTAALLCLMFCFPTSLPGAQAELYKERAESFKESGNAFEEQATSSKRARILSRHPAVILHRLKKSIQELIVRPGNLLHMGLKKVPGDQQRYARVLQFIFRDSSVESISFPGISLSKLSAGKIPAISVVVSNISLGTLKIDSMALTFYEVGLSVDKILEGRVVFTSLEKFDFTLSISEETLDRIAGNRVVVSISSDVVEFAVPVKSFLLSLTLRARGNLLVKNGEAIHFAVTNVNLANLPFSQLLAGRIAREVNPLFSLNKYMGRARSVSDITLLDVVTKDRAFAIHGEGTFELQAP